MLPSLIDLYESVFDQTSNSLDIDEVILYVGILSRGPRSYQASRELSVNRVIHISHTEFESSSPLTIKSNNSDIPDICPIF